MFTPRPAVPNPRPAPRGESAGTVHECEPRRIRRSRRKPAKMTAQPPRAAPVREPAAAPGRRVARRSCGRRRRDARAVPQRSGRCGMPSRRSGAEAGEHGRSLAPVPHGAERACVAPPCSPRGGRRSPRGRRPPRRGESMPPRPLTGPDGIERPGWPGQEPSRAPRASRCPGANGVQCRGRSVRAPPAPGASGRSAKGLPPSCPGHPTAVLLAGVWESARSRWNDNVRVALAAAAGVLAAHAVRVGGF